ncbi:hypothetical protein [Marivita sp. GX14005]|uniref:hypothetical protein n=1 Tax=Marivita sp. GX14005 TaxID=2942276 RepID=UPI0020185624|nr:hypothetical protein [Marivita sp. GX14005]MCL3881507.1 hypothetical protein [Marivita sp. GX14005]
MILILYLAFYLFGLAMGRALNLPRQAFVIGSGISAAGLSAGLTLWLLARTALIEPWLAIAMIGTIALPALMIGLGLLAGWLMRRSAGKWRARFAAAILPLGMLALLIWR